MTETELKQETQQERERGITITHVGKQETPEEAAERLFPTTIDSYTDNGLDLSERERLIFIKGAKWQQERMYSEEDIEEYAEYCTNHVLTTQIGNPYLSINKWFEQFKKK